jgi:predicted esterase
MKQQLKTSKTARYFTHGNPNKAENIWIVLHGYNQLAPFFIRKFQHLDPDKHFVVAPEGLHRFYRKGTSGRVGASWMTKEDRESDINDNANFLNNLSDTLLAKYTFQKRILLGFSQGGATATRWNFSGKFNANHLILWACVFPPDLEKDKEEKDRKEKTNYFVLGKNDQFFEAHYQEIIEQYAEKGLLIKEFDGFHDIEREMLTEIAIEIE